MHRRVGQQGGGDSPAAAATPGRAVDTAQVMTTLRSTAAALGFSQIGVAGIDLGQAEAGLRRWLEAGFHGSMAYMQRHGLKRARPAELVPGTASVICARMDYVPDSVGGDWLAHERRRLAEPGEAVVSLYARGRDYHKVLRQRLQRLADALAAQIGPFGHRVFVDSAPLMEVELAARAGLGWRGKHTLLLDREAGSMFFLGEICCDLALPPTPMTAAHCGSCSACIDACPTGAIVAPFRLDARRCISYLTIEHEGPIDEALRPLMGNRIYGCDDCQLACPWNKYARRSMLPDFAPRHGLDAAQLLALWRWSEPDFERRTEGSAIRRIGWQRWRRNLAVALGNALRLLGAADAGPVTIALFQARPGADALVAGHIDWALRQRKAAEAASASGNPAAANSVDSVIRPAT